MMGLVGYSHTRIHIVMHVEAIDSATPKSA